MFYIYCRIYFNFEVSVQIDPIMVLLDDNLNIGR